jgi:hypothetical protein
MDITPLIEEGFKASPAAIAAKDIAECTMMSIISYIHATRVPRITASIVSIVASLHSRKNKCSPVKKLIRVLSRGWR